MGLRLYNTLTRNKDKFVPIKKNNVGMYSCGPTVYAPQHIGNFRTALLADFLKRILLYNKYKVKHIVNFTDVDDKIINATRKEGIGLKKLTSKYENIFLKDLDSLNIVRPTKFLRATENIDSMVKMIQNLIKKGYAYEANDGIYFSISKFKDYGLIAGLNRVTNVKERVRSDEYDKTNPQDFALWKFYSNDDGEVYWNTPIGKGRPGWHIECSAMSTKALGDSFDIHTGGMDLIFPHHANEIAQSEGCNGKKFVNYWIHGGMLNLKEGKMSKSLGNIYTITDLRDKGFEPLCYRYLCLQTHYRKPLEFSFDSLEASKNALARIERKVINLRNENSNGNAGVSDYEKLFFDAINDDVNMPQALEVFWSLLDDTDVNSKVRLKTLVKFDNVLGLGIKEMNEKKVKIPKGVNELVKKREVARKNRDWNLSDKLRDELVELGFSVEDTSEGQVVRKI
ncbi:MAG: cysteine--tRNA ligase [Nanoarchaeota archaeon]